MVTAQLFYDDAALASQNINNLTLTGQQWYLSTKIADQHSADVESQTYTVTWSRKCCKKHAAQLPMSCRALHSWCWWQWRMKNAWAESLFSIDHIMRSAEITTYIVSYMVIKPELRFPCQKTSDVHLLIEITYDGSTRYQVQEAVVSNKHRYKIQSRHHGSLQDMQSSKHHKL